MLLSVYKIRTYAQLDTWSHGTKQSQTKPILHKKPLPSQQKTALSSLFTRSYATTPQSQKQSQTNPISPPAAKKLLDDPKQSHKKHRAGTSRAPDTLTRYISTNQGPTRYDVFRTKRYDTASGAAERASNNIGRSRLKDAAIIPTSSRSSAAPPPRLCRLNNRRQETTGRMKNPPTILTDTHAFFVGEKSLASWQKPSYNPTFASQHGLKGYLKVLVRRVTSEAGKVESGCQDVRWCSGQFESRLQIGN